jgi:hypothetical protein
MWRPGVGNHGRRSRVNPQAGNRLVNWKEHLDLLGPKEWQINALEDAYLEYHEPEKKQISESYLTSGGLLAKTGLPTVEAVSIARTQVNPAGVERCPGLG